MIPITTYQSMCSDVLCEGQDGIAPTPNMHSMAFSPSSRLPRSMEAAKKKQPNEPIPLYFAWNRLDPSYKDDRGAGIKPNPPNRGKEEARPPPQCRPDENEKDSPKAAASSSHHFLVDPNLIDDDDNEPFITEYADKYRAWTVPAANKSNANKGKGRLQEERGVELALRGMGISPTPPRMHQTQQKPPTCIAPSSLSIGSSRRKPRMAESESMGPSPTSLAVDAPVLITCDNRTEKTSELDEQSYQTGTTAPSTPTGSADGVCRGGSPAKEDTRQVLMQAPVLAPPPTSQKNALTEKDGDIWIITSGKQQQHKTRSKPRNKTCSKLRETRRDMAFWKSSSSSLGIPCPATPNHSVSKGRARRFGEKNGVESGSTHIRSSTAAAQSCPSPRKLSKMLLTSRRGLSSTKLFPRLPNDPFRKNSLKRKV